MISGCSFCLDHDVPAWSASVHGTPVPPIPPSAQLQPHFTRKTSQEVVSGIGHGRFF